MFCGASARLLRAHRGLGPELLAGPRTLSCRSPHPSPDPIAMQLGSAFFSGRGIARLPPGVYLRLLRKFPSALITERA